jgi:hypothetical protein
LVIIAISAFRASALAIFSAKWFKVEVLRDANKIKDLAKIHKTAAGPEKVQ